MKKLAARDFEDILQVSAPITAYKQLANYMLLQCSIPCFEGLLPSPHNESITDLLFITNYWHSLAKLRMHTDSTLEVLNNITTTFGQCMRHFAEETCSKFETFETDKEHGARTRAEAARQKKRGATGASGSASTDAPGKRRKGYNLMTSKLHALGDCVRQIWLLGTTNSFTTQIVSFLS